MKKIYLFLAATLIGTASFAQATTYTVNLNLTTPVSQSTVAPGMIPTSFTLTNEGPATISAGDTLFFSYLHIISQTQFTLYSLTNTSTPNNVTGFILDADFPPSTTMTFAELTGSQGFNLDATTFAANTGVQLLFHGVNSPALTQDGDPNLLNDSFDFFIIGSSVGIDQSAIAGLKAFPVPTEDVLNFTANEEIVNINIMSLDGKVVANAQGSSINVAELSTGAYIYEVTSVSGITTTNKFIKK